LQRLNEFVAFRDGTRAILVDELYVETFVFLEMLAHTDDVSLRNRCFEALFYKLLTDQCVIRGFSELYPACRDRLDFHVSRLNPEKKYVLRKYRQPIWGSARQKVVAYIVGHELAHVLSSARICNDMASLLLKRLNEFKEQNANAADEGRRHFAGQIAVDDCFGELLADYSGVMRYLIAVREQGSILSVPKQSSYGLRGGLGDFGAVGDIHTLIWVAMLLDQLMSFAKSVIDGEYSIGFGYKDHRYFNLWARNNVLTGTLFEIFSHHGLGGDWYSYISAEKHVETNILSMSDYLARVFLRDEELFDLVMSPESRRTRERIVQSSEDVFSRFAVKIIM
jgi:hypothetical protein